MAGMNHIAIVLAGGLAVGAAAGLHGPATVASDNACKVTLSAGLNNTTPGDKRTRYLFGVGVDSAEACADVTFVLVVTEQLPDGSTKTTELPGELHVANQTRIAAVPFETDARNKVTGFEPRLKTCTLCNAP